MKPKLITTSILLALFTSCAPIGLYSKGDLKRAAERAKRLGQAEERSLEAERRERQRQFALSQPQPAIEPYELNIPAHTTWDGINIEQHKRIVEFATQ